MMKNVVENLRNENVKMSGVKINQVQARAIKEALTNAIADLIGSQGIEGLRIEKTLKGYGIEIANEEIGCINAELNLVIKDSDYDLETEHTFYVEDQEQKAKAKEEKEKAKAEKIKADIEKRRLKEELKKLNESAK